MFAGPSVYGLELDLGKVLLRPPAEQGDIERAVEEGASAIGLIDGHYQQIGSVWHKEILFALTEGVAVFGAASMGALRAAECQAFGMVPIGEIAWGYCSGFLFDDADVALVTGPKQLDYVPFTEPLVDVLATIESLRTVGILSASEAQKVERAARSTHFADRTLDTFIAEHSIGERAAELRGQYERHRVRLKGHDALELLDILRARPDARGPRPDWQIAKSPFWQDRRERPTQTL